MPTQSPPSGFYIFNGTIGVFSYLVYYIDGEVVTVSRPEGGTSRFWCYSLETGEFYVQRGTMSIQVLIDRLGLDGYTPGSSVMVKDGLTRSDIIGRGDPVN